MKINDIYNVSTQQQLKTAILQQIAEESHEVNLSVSQIKQKIQTICLSKLSKETKQKKIKDILNYIKNYSDSWINSCNFVDREKILVEN